MKDLQRPSEDTDADPVSPAATSEVQRATRDILASAGIEMLPEFSAEEPNTEPAQKPKPPPASAAMGRAVRFFASFAASLSDVAERAKKALVVPFLAALPALLSRISRKPAKPSASAESEAAPQKKPSSDDAAAASAPMPTAAKSKGALLLASFAARVPQFAERVKSAVLALRSRITRKPEKPPAPTASEVSPPKKPLLGALEEETKLENVLASIAIKAPPKQAKLFKESLATLVTVGKGALEKASTMLAPLPKAVRYGGAGVVALLFLGIIVLMLKPGAHHARHAVVRRYTVTSEKLPPEHRPAAGQPHHAAAGQPHRSSAEQPNRADAGRLQRASGMERQGAGYRHPPRRVHAGHLVVAPEAAGSESSAASNDHAADAAVVSVVRRKISQLCGLQVSKVYRWKYRDGYLFCYSRSGGRDTSAILERGEDGIFTLIGGSKGLMTYEEMTDTFLVDGAIARYLLE